MSSALCLVTLFLSYTLWAVNFTKTTDKPVIFTNQTHDLYTILALDRPAKKLNAQAIKPAHTITLTPHEYYLESVQVINSNTKKPAVLHVFERLEHTKYTIIDTSQHYDSFQLDFDYYLQSNGIYYTDCITNTKRVYQGGISSDWYTVSLPTGVTPAQFIERMRTLYYTYFAPDGSHIVQPDYLPRIPKIVHQIWIGSKPVPEKYREYQKKWQELHPAWSYKLWTNTDIKHIAWSSPALKQVFDQAKNYAAQADILKIQLLHTYGGVYVDLDTEPLEPLDSLAHRFDFFGLLYGPHKGTLVIDAFFLGACPRHAIIAKTLKNIVQLAHKIPNISHVTNNKQFIYNLISAVMPLTHAVWSQAGRNTTRDILLPIRYFNNYATSSVSYGVHYPERSWQKTPHKT